MRVAAPQVAAHIMFFVLLGMAAGVVPGYHCTRSLGAHRPTHTAHTDWCTRSHGRVGGVIPRSTRCGPGIASASERISFVAERRRKSHWFDARGGRVRGLGGSTTVLIGAAGQH